MVRQLIVHRAQDLASRRGPATPRTRDAWLLAGDEDVIRRSRDLARRPASTDGDAQREIAPSTEVPEPVAASAPRGYGRHVSRTPLTRAPGRLSEIGNGEFKS